MSQWISCQEQPLGSQVCLCLVFLVLDTKRSVIDAKANRRRQPGQDASRFKTDEETGKMVIDEDSDSDDAAAARNAATDVAGAAYRETMTSVDGFTRGPNGRVKFNKDTKKRRREEDALQDVEMADAEEVSAGSKAKKPKKKDEPKFGHEFKAKVRSHA
jgi:ribosomal RNA-processing protein 12